MAKRLSCLSVVFLFALAIMGTAVWAQSGKMDVKVVRLVREVRGKGWIVFSGVTAKRDYDLFVMRPDGTRKRNLTNTPDMKYVVFAKLPKDGAFDAPMGVMRLSDAPNIGGKSTALHKMFGNPKGGPMVPLPAGFEPRSTYLDIGAKKK